MEVIYQPLEGKAPSWFLASPFGADFGNWEKWNSFIAVGKVDAWEAVSS